MNIQALFLFKKRFKMVLFLLFIFSFRLFAVDFTQEDKQKHFTASTSLAVGFFYYYDTNYDLYPYQVFIASVVSTLIVGDLKERYWEEQYSIKYDKEDMRANFWGASFGASVSLFSSELERRKKQKKQIEKLKRVLDGSD